MRDQKITKKPSFYSIIILIIAGSAMIAHGLRMMSQGLFQPKSFYPAPLPTTIDFWFDWFLLSALGLFVIHFAFKRYLAMIQNQKQSNHIG